MEINAARLISTAVDKVLGISMYQKIQSLYASTDVSSSKEFQRAFTLFYRVRCPEEWRRGFFKIFQKLRAKGTQLNIATILNELDEMCNASRIDLSFASKMLHTINPDMPIWDSIVRKNLEMRAVPPKGSRGRIEAAITIYDELIEKMQDLLRTEHVQNQIQLFDSLLPEYRDISQMKKLDFMVWGDKRDYMI